MPSIHADLPKFREIKHKKHTCDNSIIKKLFVKHLIKIRLLKMTFCYRLYYPYVNLSTFPCVPFQRATPCQICMCSFSASNTSFRTVCLFSEENNVQKLKAFFYTLNKVSLHASVQYLVLQFKILLKRIGLTDVGRIAYKEVIEILSMIKLKAQMSEND